MKEIETITNWTMFGVQSVSIGVYRYDVDDQDHYNAGITFFLDDGQEEDGDKVITTFTDIWLDDLYECAYEAASCLSKLYSIADTFFVFDEDCEIIAEHTLDEAEKIVKENRETVH